MPEEVQFRYRSTYFKHIFGSDGYAAGYYTYLWAEVLDADGFELFVQTEFLTPQQLSHSSKTFLNPVEVKIP